MKTHLLLSLLALSLGALRAPAANSDRNSTSVAFSNRAQPGRLEVSLAAGSLSIRGADVNEITVSSSVNSNNAVRADGLRVLGASTGFNLSESNNVARLEYLGGIPTRVSRENGDRIEITAPEFEVTVPRGTSILVNGQPGPSGRIEIAAVSGDVEVRAMTGDITLSALRGGAIAETMSGNINATFAEFSGKAVSFTSMRGRIEVRVPPAAKAAVRLRSYTGEILTDFDDKALVTKTEQAGLDIYHRVATASGRSIGLAALEAEEAKARAAADAAAQQRNILAEQGARVLEQRTLLEREKDRAGDATSRAVRIATDNSSRTLKTFTIPPMTGGKLVTGTLNGGGAEISLATMNGDVTLRKAAP